MLRLSLAWPMRVSWRVFRTAGFLLFVQATRLAVWRSLPAGISGKPAFERIGSARIYAAIARGGAGIPAECCAFQRLQNAFVFRIRARTRRPGYLAHS